MYDFNKELNQFYTFNISKITISNLMVISTIEQYRVIFKYESKLRHPVLKPLLTSSELLVTMMFRWFQIFRKENESIKNEPIGKPKPALQHDYILFNKKDTFIPHQIN